MKNLPIVSSEQKRGSSSGVGVLEISRPECLNALNTECYKTIETRLLDWAKQTDIAAILIYSNNPKAFCAGGDVKNLAIETQQRGIEVAEEFFTREYFVDRLVYHIEKPIVVIADGITMGAGIGLVNGASHRIVTERSVFAMPEVHIGLFPDVGGTYFLSRLPHNFGVFMGLTGTRITGDDALAVGLADYLVPSKSKNKIIADLISVPWADSNEANSNMISNYFMEAFSANKDLKANMITENLKDYFAIKNIFEEENYDKIESYLTSTSLKSRFLMDARNKFMSASPQSKRLFHTAIQRNKNLSLNQCFITEWEMAIRSCLEAEFFEGVRAALIDKDHKPKWRAGSELQESLADINRFFSSGRTKNLLADKFSQFFGEV